MTEKVLPSQEALRQLLDYNPETGVLTWRKREAALFNHTKNPQTAANRWNGRSAGKQAFNIDHGNGYNSGSLWKERLYAHRVIWKLVTGVTPSVIDHINGNRSDNRLSNLRLVDKTRNSQNAAKPVTNTSGCVGVSYASDKAGWHAYIGQDNKRMNLGHFGCVTAAIVARKAAEVRLGYHQNHGR